MKCMQIIGISNGQIEMCDKNARWKVTDIWGPLSLCCKHKAAKEGSKYNLVYEAKKL